MPNPTSFRLPEAHGPDDAVVLRLLLPQGRFHPGLTTAVLLTAGWCITSVYAIRTAFENRNLRADREAAAEGFQRTITEAVDTAVERAVNIMAMAMQDGQRPKVPSGGEPKADLS